MSPAPYIFVRGDYPCDILVNAKLRRHVYTDCYSAEIHHVLKHVLKLIY